MYLKKLLCSQFKNHIDKKLNFIPNINIISGKNGVGKTNILDAIHYLSTTKSAFTSNIETHITHSKNHFIIEGDFIKYDISNVNESSIDGFVTELDLRKTSLQRCNRGLLSCNTAQFNKACVTQVAEEKQDTFKGDENIYNVKCSYSNDTKKIIQINNAKCKKMKEHIGRFPIIFFSPNDIDAFKWGSEYRRKIFDIITCQVDADYMNNLIEYNKFLKHKNILLKNYNKSRYIDYTLVDCYDENLQSLGKKIYKKRKEFIEDFAPLFVEEYLKVVFGSTSIDNISKNRQCGIINDKTSHNSNYAGYNDEMPSIRYESHFLDSNFNVKGSIDKDLILGYSTTGIHKDDYCFLLNDYPLKHEGSEGQKRTFFIALRLAQRNFIHNKTGISPILLMDDIFDNLDQDRMCNIMKIIDQQNFGQIFITCTTHSNITRLTHNICLNAKIVVL